MEEQTEKRLNSLEAGFHIVANDMVGKIEEVHRDVRELGRESREQGRELREIRRDMAGSFAQVVDEFTHVDSRFDDMTTKQDLADVEARMNMRMNLLASKLDQVLALLTPKQAE